ncbi:Trp biosynthesis-associated membrane protein [Spongiactinospora sp. TRM90649]|uniref:Trp biosynthesis-associated membrane protein n=1 Tax=Spongiactinospora sp. TRM90649 TaxID=3031114 RepID=UPI0023F61A03|nr:Trp biosynthesis-associated membrane protein [Spongiactinospora sp. TRM90649]MDF5755986.1 Trp biosynthesis-associated membrane protein [Spongiactinospora sp. TRM90649]
MTGTSRRELGVWIASCAVGAGLALFAASRDWALVTLAGATGGRPSTVGVTGSALVPVLTPLALAAAASAVAVLAARGVWRCVVGVVLVLCGAGMAAAALTGAAGRAAAEAAARDNALALSAEAAAETLWTWPGLAAAGGVVLACAGVVAMIRGGHWAGMSGRYDRPGPTGGARAEARGERAMWDALDEGVDPTVDPVQESRER